MPFPALSSNALISNFEIKFVLRVQTWGMGDNSIFSVFSNIWSSARLKIPHQFQASWQHRLLTLDMGSLKKMTPFPFTFLQLCSLCFYILLLLIKVCYYYMLVSIKISLKYLFPEKNTVEIFGKNARTVTHFA